MKGMSIMIMIVAAEGSGALQWTRLESLGFPGRFKSKRRCSSLIVAIAAA